MRLEIEETNESYDKVAELKVISALGKSYFGGIIQTVLGSTTIIDIGYESEQLNVNKRDHSLQGQSIINFIY